MNGNCKRIQRGQQLIRQGKVGCLLIAGGQGTRFGLEGGKPKGAYPISNIQKDVNLNQQLWELASTYSEGIALN